MPTSIMLAPLHEMPIEDEKFDAVLCTQVLEHLEWPRESAKEMYRVLKAGGKLYMTVPWHRANIKSPTISLDIHPMVFDQYVAMRVFEKLKLPRLADFGYVGLTNCQGVCQLFRRLDFEAKNQISSEYCCSPLNSCNRDCASASNDILVFRSVSTMIRTILLVGHAWQQNDCLAHDLKISLAPWVAPRATKPCSRGDTICYGHAWRIHSRQMRTCGFMRTNPRPTPTPLVFIILTIMVLTSAHRSERQSDIWASRNCSSLFADTNFQHQDARVANHGAQKAARIWLRFRCIFRTKWRLKAGMLRA